MFEVVANVFNLVIDATDRVANVIEIVANVFKVRAIFEIFDVNVAFMHQIVYFLVVNALKVVANVFKEVAMFEMFLQKV